MRLWGLKLALAMAVVLAIVGIGSKTGSATYKLGEGAYVAIFLLLGLWGWIRWAERRTY